MSRRATVRRGPALGFIARPAEGTVFAGRPTMKLLVLGGGLTGTAVGSLAASRGAVVTTSTRGGARRDAIAAAGFVPLALPPAPALDPAACVAQIDGAIDDDTRVLVTFPPDGTTDAALAKSSAIRRARAVAYVSTTGVHGAVSGRVDEETPVVLENAIPAPSARVLARIAAERAWAAAGATIVRAPGIYGPARGIHTRLASGAMKTTAPDAPNRISRIHVDDLAAALLAVLGEARSPGLPRDARVFVVGDLEPAPHHEVVRWVSAAMGIPVPPVDPAALVDESLRHDRAVDGARIRSEFGLALAYPSYREGYRQCIACAPR
jgi:nucleoside-diphosphate-sugar epimerase